MNLVYGRDQEVAKWVAQHAPHAENGFDKYVAIGVEKDGELVAGCVYNEFRGHSIHVSIASTTPRWATRSTLAAFFGYPFEQLQVKRLTAYTGKSMQSVRDFLERLGFKPEGCVRDGFADDDCMVYGMLRNECRWI
jgi:RimJ/RimL family protein N-acetyltransferase